MTVKVGRKHSFVFCLWGRVKLGPEKGEERGLLRLSSPLLQGDERWIPGAEGDPHPWNSWLSPREKVVLTPRPLPAESSAIRADGPSWLPNQRVSTASTKETPRAAEPGGVTSHLEPRGSITPPAEVKLATRWQQAPTTVLLRGWAWRLDSSQGHHPSATQKHQ